MRLCLNVIPGALALVTVFLLLYCPLDDETLDQIQKELEARRQGEA